MHGFIEGMEKNAKRMIGGISDKRLGRCKIWVWLGMKNEKWVWW